MAPIRIVALGGDQTAASRAVYDAVLEATAAGIRTPDRVATPEPRSSPTR
jgi:hypothetical protein